MDGRAPHMRLFVAIDLPVEVIDALVDWQQSVLAGRPALRGLEPAALHLTLCFLGSRPVSALPAIESALVRAGEAGGAGAGEGSNGEDRAVRRPAATLALGDALWLPVRRPQVLTVTVQDPGEALAILRTSLDRTLADACGYEPERRAFRPHVTVARVRSRTRVVAEPLAAPPHVAFAARRMSLYVSHLGSGAARYEPLATIDLQSQ